MNLNTKEIDDAFEAASPVELEAKLEDAAAAGLEWATKTLKALRKGCPLSVAAAMEYSERRVGGGGYRRSQTKR